MHSISPAFKTVKMAWVAGVGVAVPVVIQAPERVAEVLELAGVELGRAEDEADLLRSGERVSRQRESSREPSQQFHLRKEVPEPQKH